ncbi:hypothetical protein C2G38_2160142 [Gigaspora rosea]|uniref:Uncharacterized protein n=1 Tax=Gigaspora rosea TaxID=44941 RepID=A0A397W076_9GLOM|nr:hypothetical protein C2G38_2160142 [Gigaspora rosea]
MRKRKKPKWFKVTKEKVLLNQKSKNIKLAYRQEEHNILDLVIKKDFLENLKKSTGKRTKVERKKSELSYFRPIKDYVVELICSQDRSLYKENNQKAVIEAGWLLEDSKKEIVLKKVLFNSSIVIDTDSTNLIQMKKVSLVLNKIKGNSDNKWNYEADRLVKREARSRSHVNHSTRNK